MGTIFNCIVSKRPITATSKSIHERTRVPETEWAKVGSGNEKWRKQEICRPFIEWGIVLCVGFRIWCLRSWPEPICVWSASALWSPRRQNHKPTTFGTIYLQLFAFINMLFLIFCNVYSSMTMEYSWAGDVFICIWLYIFGPTFLGPLEVKYSNSSPNP